MSQKLNANQEKILIFLHENQDREPSFEEIVAGTSLPEKVVRDGLTALKELGYVNAPNGLLENSTELLKKIEPNMGPTDDGFPEFIILVASYISKAQEKFLAEQLGYDQEFVSLVGARLRAAKIWIGEKISETRQTAWKDGANFFLDGLVACGNFNVTFRQDGEPLYAFSTTGRAKAEKMMKGMKK